MTLAVSLNSGTIWFTSEYETLADLKQAIANDIPIKCWYYMTHGQRVIELVIFKEEQITLLRTESDD